MTKSEMQGSGEAIERQRLPRRAIALALFVILSAAAGLTAFLEGWISPETIQAMTVGAGPAGMVAFVGAVVVLETIWMPRAWGLIAGGLLFGPLVGACLCFVADTLGALLCYGLGRGGGRRWVEAMLTTRPKAERVVRLLARRRGVFSIALLRVLPIAHYTAVSYAAGLVGVPALRFLLGNTLGLLPFAFLFPFVGNAALAPTSPAFLIGVSIFAAAAIASGFIARRLLRDE